MTSTPPSQQTSASQKAATEIQLEVACQSDMERFATRMAMVITTIPYAYISIVVVSNTTDCTHQKEPKVITSDSNTALAEYSAKRFSVKRLCVMPWQWICEKR